MQVEFSKIFSIGWIFEKLGTRFPLINVFWIATAIEHLKFSSKYITHWYSIFTSERDIFPFIAMLKSGIELFICWTKEEKILIHPPVNELKNADSEFINWHPFNSSKEPSKKRKEHSFVWRNLHVDALTSDLFEE
jgi:hypothetical protein